MLVIAQQETKMRLARTALVLFVALSKLLAASRAGAQGVAASPNPLVVDAEGRSGHTPIYQVEYPRLPKNTVNGYADFGDPLQASGLKGEKDLIHCLRSKMKVIGTR